MRPREASARSPEKARRNAERRVSYVSELERDHARLQHLYDISKLLMRVSELDRTAAELIELVAQTIPVRSAIVMLEATGLPDRLIWQDPRQAGAGLEAALAHVQAAHDYLMHTREEGIESKAREGASRLSKDSGTDLAPVGRYIVLPLLIAEGPLLGTLQIEGAEALDEDALMFVNAVANLVSVALHRQTTAARAERDQLLLASVGTILESYLDHRATLSAVARCVVPLFADLCVIDELLPDGAVRRMEVVFADERKQSELAPELRRFAPGPAWKTPEAAVIQAGRPLLFVRVAEPLAQGIAHSGEHAEVVLATGVRSMMTLPLQACGRTLGAITLAMAESGRCYAARDLVLAGEFARRVAAAIDNAALYQKAQRATQARQDLLAVVSHDLKNPLGSIMMTTDSLLKLTPEAPLQVCRGQLELIKRAGVRMTRLIADLLDTASIEGGQLSVNMDCLDVVAQIAEALDTVRPLAASKALELRSELPPAMPDVCGDGPRLQQVLMNLLGNAIKFTSPGGIITVGAKAADDNVTISVHDTGTGIPQSNLPHVFDRFWKVRHTGKQGTGLGLFIVKGIVEAHGGKVWVESQLGAGSTFSFTLRRA